MKFLHHLNIYSILFTIHPFNSECLDGIVSCFEDYVPSGPDNHLNASQLEKLENELTQLFLFQYFHDDHVLIDIRHIHQHPITSKCQQSALTSC